MPVVTRDATSGNWLAQSAAEAVSLYGGRSVSIPAITALWLCQEASGSLTDTTGNGHGLVSSGLGACTYQSAVGGYTTKAVVPAGGDIRVFTDSTWADASSAVFAVLNFPSGNATGNPFSALTFGAAFNSQVALDIKLSQTPTRLTVVTTTDTQTAGTSNTTGVHPVVLVADKTLAIGKFVTDLETVSHATTAANSWGAFTIGGNNSQFWTSPGAGYMYMVAFSGSGAELTATQAGILIDAYTNGPAVTSIAVTPSSATLATLGATQTLVATSTRNDTSTFVNTTAVTWLSSNPSVATVSSSGVVTAVANGSANITCTFASLSSPTITSNTVVITVATSGATLTSITITPANKTLLPADTQQLTATGNWSNSTHTDLTATATWASSSSSNVLVSSAGIVTGVFNGPSTITATSSAIVGTTIVTVGDVPSPFGTIYRVDHVTVALSRLCQQFKGKPNIEALLTIFASRYNDLEAVFWAMLTLRNIARAVGDQLDTIGAIVGLQRNGLDDTTYRQYLYAKIAVNRSHGVTEDLIAVAKLMLTGLGATIVVSQEGTATVRVRVAGITLSDTIGSVLADFEQSAAVAGVRVVTEWSNSLPAATFTFDIGPGFNTGHLASSKG